MTELSPGTKVLIDVVHVFMDHGGDPPTRLVAAAAIRAAVDQVVPVDRGTRRQCNIRAALIAIIDELEGSR
jgi:hypothetical protein